MGAGADRTPALAQAAPLSVSVDEDAALIQNTIEEKWGLGLDSRQVSNIDAAAGDASKPTRKLEPGCASIVGQRHENIKI